ncbi:MAG: DUF192 domain-containing protein [Patescibacteria group bacterium]
MHVFLRAFVFWVLFSISCLGFRVYKTNAIVDPLTVPNNKFGVHILEPGEISAAAKLVNSSGGDWGYVTIPIRSNDRDQAKWTEFFKNAANLHLIPILRITTYPDKANWTAPTANDLVDFANFLDELPWPTKNRYIILFNEPNHSKEWGGYLSPLEYANLLTESNRIFKTRSEDFFLISAGLDMSAPQSITSLDALYYIRELNRLRPRWFDTVDGLSFHAYPNPAFSASTFSKTRYGPKSYTYELDLLAKAGLPKDKPIFITETGTILQNSFYKDAFTSVWTEDNIVAITPFLLFAGSPDFADFSLLDKDHQPKSTYKQILALPKTVGSPLLAPPVPSSVPEIKTATSVILSRAKDPIKNFIDALKKFISSFQKEDMLSVGSSTFRVEIKDTPKERAQGLSGRTSLDEGHGMLFIFDKPDIYQFWMKDMRFPLDFVWIDNGQVVELIEDVPNPTKDDLIPQIITPTQKVRQVLEIPAGSIKKFKIKVGNSVILNP